MLVGAQDKDIAGFRRHAGALLMPAAGGNLNRVGRARNANRTTCRQIVIRLAHSVAAQNVRY